MEGMLQRHCARYIYVIPEGLRELMADISREVLRSQPEDIYTFVADYLDALMITRENARVAARLVQSLTEMATTTAEFLEETGMPRDEIDNIVNAIQKTFKKSIDSEEGKEPSPEDQNEDHIISDILNEIRVSPEQAEVAAVVIQQAYRRFRERKEREKELLAGMVDWRVAARSAIHLYRKTGVTNEEANRAATLIKAAYKGYYTRKLMKKIVSEGKHFFMQDVSALPLDYDIEDEGEEFSLGEEDSDDRPRSVKIDYSTVKPHVDFDTQEPKLTTSQDFPSRMSTTSSIIRHSLRQIFDEALERIARQSTIPEELGEGNSAVTADFLVERVSSNVSEVKNEDSDHNAVSSASGVDNLEVPLEAPIEEVKPPENDQGE